MSKRKDYFAIGLTLIAAVLMTGQILEGIRWMCRNITAMPSFGDGAPLNDRYALLIYFFWSLVSVCGVQAFWNTCG